MKPVPVRISNDGTYWHSGTKLEIDGQEVPELANVSFHHRAGQSARVTAEVNCLGPFHLDVMLPAEVVVMVEVPPGCDLISETSEDGKTKRHRVVVATDQ